MCPVGNVPLVDLALERVAAAVAEVAVNLHHGGGRHRRAPAARRAPVVGADEPLGTAGALGHLRGWIAGRSALVVNADAWCPGSLTDLASGWDGERIRLLLAGDDDLQPTSRRGGRTAPVA